MRYKKNTILFLIVRVKFIKISTLSAFKYIYIFKTHTNNLNLTDSMKKFTIQFCRKKKRQTSVGPQNCQNFDIIQNCVWPLNEIERKTAAFYSFIL